MELLERGFANLAKQIENMHAYGVPTVVVVNQFAGDTAKEIEYLLKACREVGASAATSTNWFDGGVGAVDFAKEVIAACNKDSHFK